MELVVQLLIGFFSLIFVTPFLACFYRETLRKWIDKLKDFGNPCPQLSADIKVYLDYDNKMSAPQQP
jgi:hypothetical protein